MTFKLWVLKYNKKVTNLINKQLENFFLFLFGYKTKYILWLSHTKHPKQLHALQNPQYLTSTSKP